MFCQAHLQPRNACRDVVPFNDNVPAILMPGNVQCGAKGGAPVVLLSNNVLRTHMLLKPLRKERSAFPGIVPFHDYVTRDQRATETVAQRGKIGSLTTTSRIAPARTKCLALH